MTTDNQKLARLENRLGYHFKDRSLLLEALTHGSYYQENPASGAHNQRLEFLGDAVLHFILTVALYREFATEREGALSRRRAVLSKGRFLTALAIEFDLPGCLRLNKSEEDAGGRQRASTLEDAFEALVGAVFLDSDLPTTEQLVLRWYGPLGPRLAKYEDTDNPKGRLQEIVQPEHGNTALSYEVMSTTGPRHARVFEVSVRLNGRELGTGRGSSKKLAEEAAARVALEGLGDQVR